MCKQCETNPVYEFTNKRKLCKNCFIQWFQRKFLYTIRKFKMVSKGDVILFENTGNYRGVVLNDLLKMYSERGVVKIVKDKKASKIAISSTTDSEANEIIHILIKGSVSKLKQGPVENIRRKIVIKPLYLFLDKEVLLYAKLKKLKFRNIKYKNTENTETKSFCPTENSLFSVPFKSRKFEGYKIGSFESKKFSVLKTSKGNQEVSKDKISLFLEDLEKKHPEVKQSVISSYLELFS